MTGINRAASGVTGDLSRGDVVAGYRRCAEITRTRGTTYHWGARLLPRQARRHVYAVYTLCRLADDIVDAPNATEPARVAQTEAELAAFRARFDDAVAHGSDEPVLAAIGQSVRTTAIDQGCFDRFFMAMARDLSDRAYETWADLLDYMDGSAAVIGEMMLPVLRPRSPAALEPARALGLAFQLTNFLRDVGEDLDRGRVYLPQEDLRRFDADPWLRTVTPQWRALMSFEIERNRELYRQADAGIALLPPASARCVATARVAYSRILDRIEKADYDVFATRVRVPRREKLAIAARHVLLGRQPRRSH